MQHSAVCAGNKTLGECFALFDLIHKVTTTHAIVGRLTQQVLAAFAADGVAYVELRTTPKACWQCLAPHMRSGQHSTGPLQRRLAQIRA